MSNATSFCDSLAQTPQLLSVVIQQPAYSWLTILSSLATPFIAVLGIWIAYRQSRTARYKLKLDLYETRLSIYEAARHAIGTIVTSGQTNNEIERTFLVGIAGAKWLFDKELERYLRQTLWAEIVHLGTLQGELDGLERGLEKTQLIAKRTAQMTSLNKRLSELDEKFYKFMHLQA
jgi:hypothetical protein